MIRLTAIDMDGTLLDSRKRKPADFADWVKAHPQIKTVIASGRQYYTLLDDFTEIGEELVFLAENGGVVFEKGEMIYIDEMNREDVREILESAEAFPNVHVIVCGADSAYMYPCRPEIAAEGRMYYHHLQFVQDLMEAGSHDRIVKVSFFVEQEQAAKVFDSLQVKPHLQSVLSGASWIDIANATVGKGKTLAAIQQRFSITPDECMAFGDYLNDMSLLQAVTESYCMANGHPELKKIAKHLAQSNDDDGVMKVLRTL